MRVLICLTAEMHAIEHMNNLQQMLPTEGLEYSMPLERYAGGRINFRRLCMSFRADRGAELLLDTPCLYEDTVLARLEATAEKSSVPAAEETALLESTPHAQEQGETPSKTASKNAELDFLLLAIRGGNHRAAAHLLGNDSGPCKHINCPCTPTINMCRATATNFTQSCSFFVGWDLLYMIDSRPSAEIMKSYGKGKPRCQ